REISRFKGYIVERGKVWEEAKKALAEALGQTRADFANRYAEHNRDRLADNQKLVEAVAKIPAQLTPMANQPVQPNAPAGSIGIDWIEIRGPVHPEGASKRSRLFTARPSGGLSQRNAAQKILADFTPRAFR